MEGGAQTSVASKGERRQVNERSTEVDFQYACGEEASGQEGAVGPSAKCIKEKMLERLGKCIIDMPRKRSHYINMNDQNQQEGEWKKVC